MILGPEEWQAVRLSLRVASVATLVSLPLAIWVAHLLARKSFWGKGLLNGLVLLPLILPPVVTGYLLLILLGRQGPLGALLERLFGLTLAFDWTGAVVAAAIMGFPLTVRAIRLAIEAVDPGLEQAARTLGAGPLRCFATVTLPLAVPGILAGAVLGFAKALGEFGATITFVSNIPGQTRTVPSAIYSFLQTPGGEGAAVRLAVLSVILAMGALALSEWLTWRARARRAS